MTFARPRAPAPVDTNQIAAFFEALVSRNRPSENITILLATMIISNVMTLAGMIIAYMTNSHAKAIAGEVNKVHLAVNSERTVTLEEVKQLKNEILKLSEQLAIGKERERGKELRDAAVAVVVPAGPLTEARLIEILNARDKK